ncbi:MAG: ABC-F family ATP-binding cassette domain-containing protein [Candidatus Riflebacteria bacterium]|nr:ABC-F family ATP-binding cassette domain-containing protein [Candidatus Riflebacteria bacterium]
MSLQITNLRKSFSVRTLFNAVSFSLNPAERIALVGPNGSGKTTLMKIILERESPDEGKIIRPRDAKIGYMPQEIFFSDEGALTEENRRNSIWCLASEAFNELQTIQDKIAQLDTRIASGEVSVQVQETRDRLFDEFERRGGYTWQSKTVRVLKGLGFPESRFNDPLNTFSGGWQMRGFFARLLLSEPDYLLLDEPTNYLDIDSIRFLESYLESYPGGILIVSHDRYFLDKLATSVVALMPEGARLYRGNYADFLDARQVWAEEAESAQKRQDKEVARIERFVERFRYKASKASQVQSRLKTLDKIKSVDRPVEQKSLGFRFPGCPESGQTVLEAKKIDKSYGANHVLHQIEFGVYKGDRLAIVGENGTGKSTLMRILAGQDIDFKGEMKLGYKVAFAYFAQDEEISFEKDETVYQRLERDAPMDMIPQLRKLLGIFLFSGDTIDKPVRVLSGGEKSRLGLARMMLRPSNLLLLDEPTNHLDISSREALLEALDEFPGTIVFVSHDRFFVDALATKVIALSSGKADYYEGNYSDYVWAKEHRIPEEKDPKSSLPVQNTFKGEEDDKRDRWKSRRRDNNKAQKIERDISELENVIASLEEKLKDLESSLSSPPPDATRDQIASLSATHASITDELNSSLEKWESLSSELSKYAES